MGDQGVDQGAVGVARCRVDDQSGGLVDDDQVVVFVEDRQGNILAFGYRRRRFGHHQGEAFSRRDLARRLAQWRAVQGQVTIDDQRLQARARQSIDRLGEHRVEALSRRRGRCLHGDRFVFRVQGERDLTIVKSWTVRSRKELKVLLSRTPQVRVFSGEKNL